MEKSELLKNLIERNWWDNDFFYYFTSKHLTKENDDEFNEGMVMFVIKRPKSDGQDIVSFYRVFEKDEKGIKVYLNSKYGYLELQKHSLNISNDDGTSTYLSEWVTI